jgi:hypothetical protein
MASIAGDEGAKQRITSLTHQHIPEVDVIKTLDDTIFGSLLLGKFSYSGEFEVNYTYIRRLDGQLALEASDFWQLVNNSKKHPEKGYIPKILAYSTQSEALKGYLDTHSDHSDFKRQMLSGDGDEFVKNISTGRIRELYFEPFPENLRMALHKKSKDKIPYSEQELLTFISSMIKTLKSLEDHGVKHGNITLDCIVPTPQAYYLYHPTLIPASVNAYNRVHALSKHYSAPEVVDLILECNTDAEFDLIKEEVDWSKADIFGIGLIALEMASLVEEEDWYNEDMILKKDILELKMNNLRNQYSSKLARLLEAILSPYQVRPSLEGLQKLMVPKGDNTTHYQRLLEGQSVTKSQQKLEGMTAIHDKPRSQLPSSFSSNRELSSKEDTPEREVSDIDSKEVRQLELKSKHQDPTVLSADLSLHHYEPQPNALQSPTTFPHKNESMHVAHKAEPAFMGTVRHFDSMLLPSNHTPHKEESPKPQWPLKHESVSDSQSKPRAVLPFDPSTVYSTAAAVNGLQVGQPYQPVPRKADDWPQASNGNQVRLPPMQTTILTPIPAPFDYLRPPAPAPPVHEPVTRVIYRQGSPDASTPRSFDTFCKDLRYDPRTAHPTGKCTVREDRSKSPKVVSIKKFIIKDGQKVLISEEHFPGYDDGFRGYIDLRGKTPEKEKENLPSTRPKDLSPELRLNPQPNTYLLQPINQNIGPPAASHNRSIEPIFGTDSMHKTIGDSQIKQMSNSKIHSLNCLQKSGTQEDFSKIAQEIKIKLDELLIKEKAREEREKQLADEASRSKSQNKVQKQGIFDTTPNTHYQASSKTLSHVNLDLSNVDCCNECRKMQKDKKSHLYKCLNHPFSPTYVEVKSRKSNRSITPEQKPISIERKLNFQHGDINLHQLHRHHKEGTPSQKGSARQSKKLVPLVQPNGNPEIVTADQVKKFRESMAKERKIKSKAYEVAADLLNFELEQRSKSRGTRKSKSKKPAKPESVWHTRLQLTQKTREK